MLGKRPRPTMRRTSSVSLIGSGCVNGDSSSPLPEHPKEKLKSCCASPSAPRQVIGFHPKPNTFLDDDLVDLSPAPARRSSPPQQQQQQGSSRSPSGSPRSGLGDLLAAGARPWERKDEGVGLGIVAALSASQEEVCKVRDEGQNRGFAVPPVYAPVPPPAPPARKTSPPPTSLFAPSRASPPIAIHPPSVSNSGYHPCPSHCTHQNCDAVAAFGLMPPTTGRPEPMFGGGGGVGARPNSSSSSSSSTVTWTRPSNSNGGGAAAAALIWGQQQQQADMEVDRCEPLVLPVSPLAHVARHSISASSAAFSQNFLDACHLCRRRLGEGRDIYIYRGDRAFCSPECRHQQILNDERTEKCSSAVMKMGGSDARSTTQRNRVMAAGTAAAA